MPTRTSDDTNSLGNIEMFLQECLGRMEPDHDRKGPGRPRILPAMALWAGLLVCVLRGFDSQLAIWRLISERGLWFFPRFPVTDQAVYKRLHAAGTEPFERIFEQITSVLAERLPGVGAGATGAIRQGGGLHRREYAGRGGEKTSCSEKNPPRRQSSAAWQAGRRVRRETSTVANGQVSCESPSER